MSVLCVPQLVLNEYACPFFFFYQTSVGVSAFWYTHTFTYRLFLLMWEETHIDTGRTLHSIRVKRLFLSCFHSSQSSSQMRSSCFTCQRVSTYSKMNVCSRDFILVTFISLSLLLFRCEAFAASKQFQATVHNTMNDYTPICHDGYMSVYISKLQFADLPFTIYVQGESDTNNTSYWSWHSFTCALCVCCACPNLNTDNHKGYYQALAVAKQCHYFLGETDTFSILTVASHGCFVKRKVSLKKKKSVSVSICLFLIFLYHFVNRNIWQIWLLSSWHLWTEEDLKLLSQYLSSV